VFAQNAAIGQIGATVNKEMQAFLNSNEYFPMPGDIFSLSIVVIGPGSKVVMGDQGNTTYSIVLRKDYSMDIPVAGLMTVKGLNFEQLRDKVIDSVKRKLAVDYIDFQFATPLSFQVFVNGLVQKPGPSNVSSVMRVYDAIQASGGFVAGATSRRIVLKRADGSERRVDIQDYLRNGSKESNPLLLPGDRISVGQALKTVRIEGAVLSPGIYELVDSDVLSDLLSFASGMTVNATKESARLVRVNDDGTYSTLYLDPAKEKNFALLNGDVFRVPTASENSSFVTVEGPFYGKANNGVDPIVLPSASLSVPAFSVDGASLQSISVPSPITVHLPHYNGMNLYDIMEKMGGPTLYARGAVGRIYGENGSERQSFDALALWAKPEECRKIIIYPGDYVFVSMKNQVVSVAGEVNIPRVLPYMEKRTVRDYLALSGGIKLTGVKDSFTLYDSIGKRVKKVDLDYVPEPEDVITVEPNGAKAFNVWWDQPGFIGATNRIIAYIGSIAALVSTVLTILKTLGIIPG
jgi:protein involved in polysaccharide export with SLBB domain